MYTSNFVANSDYLIKYLLSQVIEQEVDSKQLSYEIADHAVNTKEIISEYPRIAAQMCNIGKFSLEQLLPMINNVRLTRRPISVNRTDIFHKNTKCEYVNDQATNFMIIAKPGIKTYKLAQRMVEKFKCIHIDCNDLVEREIQNKTRLGIWLERNLQLNKILPIEIILWLIQRETRESKIMYRGYILTGIPIIPDMDLNVKKNYLTEDDFLMFEQIVNEIIDIPFAHRAHELEQLKKEIFSEYSNVEDDTDEKKEIFTEYTKVPQGLRPIPKLFHKITSDRDVRFSIKRQLDFCLDLGNKPIIAIYVDCNDDDIITKNVIFNNRKPEELDSIRVAQKRYNNALDIVQEFLCHFPRPNLIYCQGIFTSDEMFESCYDKILENGIRQVYLPESFYDLFKDDEAIIEKLEATEAPNTILDILCKIKPVREDLGWFRSSFENKCPVMLSRGKCVLGKYEHSVLYTGLIYLLSSNENKRLFLENPHHFVVLPATCRVAIMGPRRSGKSTFAKCLSKFFDNCPVIDVNYLFEYYRKINVQKLYYAQACEFAIAMLKEQQLNELNEELNDRQLKINKWVLEMTHHITNFLKAVPTKKGKTKHSPPILDKKAEQHKEQLRAILNEFGFETDHPELLKAYLHSQQLLMNKLPWDLRKSILPREPQAIDSEVKKLAIERMHELSKDYCIPFARKLEILVNKIRLCEKRLNILTKQKMLYGYWILDGLSPDKEILKGLHDLDLLPDVIVYIDDSVGERLSEIQTIQCRREFYDTNYVIDTVSRRNKALFKHLVNKFPLKNIKGIKCFEKQLVRRELDHVLMQESLQGAKDFSEENGKYREDFDQVKSFVVPLNVHIVSVDIHNKSWTESIICGIRDYINYFNGFPHVIQEEFVKTEEPKPKDKIIRFGTTADYCPVLFVDKMLLKLGFPQYSVLLKNKTYLLSSDEALQTFIKDPYKYSDIERPFQIPPYRLCVIGNYHISNRGDLRRVANILGTKHIAMSSSINAYLAKMQPQRKFNVSNFSEILEDLGENLVNDIFAPLFQEGFIMEDFPYTAEHLQQMIRLNICPEQIFYLKIENKHLIRAEKKYYMKQYKEELLEKIDDYKRQNENWISQRKFRFNKLMAELPDDFTVEEEEEEEEDETSGADRLESNILAGILKAFDVVADTSRKSQLRQMYVADMVNKEMPPDQYTNLIEQLMIFPIKDEIKDFIQNRTAEFERIKSVAEENLIPFIQIRLHPHTTKETEKSILKSIKESTDRQYIFQRAHPINYQDALDYLYYGQFMLSRYFWTCPVKNLDMDYPVKLTLRTPNLDQKLQAFIHQEHVYFVQREHHHVEQFAARPYLYTGPMNVCQITTPIRVAVHGPRNSGCQTLCNRISREFQLNNFTLGEMKKYVVKNFKWTKLAKELIRNRMQVTDNQQICDLVKITINFEKQGWIIRDLPLSDDLMKCFMLNGLDINLVIYLDPTGLDLWINIKNKYNKEKYKKKMEVLQHLFAMISELETFSNHPTNFKGLNRNIITIKDFTSRWSTWNKAYKEILLLLRLHNLYELRGVQLVAGSLYKLDVTDYELKYRLGPLKLYCPMCWMSNKLLVTYRYYYIDDEDAEPLYTDNMYDKNLFQFRKYFYWSCNNHLVELMVNAESYFPTHETLPEELPHLIKDWKNYFVTNDAYCAVAYLETANTDIIIGLSEYSVLYKDKIYVMSSQAYCMQFLQNPDKYKDVKIIFVYSVRSTVDEDFKNMKLDFGAITPTLITNALLECAFDRPKHFNLEPGQSLEIYLGLYFKCHNTSASNSEVESYKNLFLKFWDECKMVQRSINEMQIMGNPFILHVKKKRESYGGRASSNSALGF